MTIKELLEKMQDLEFTKEQVEYIKKYLGIKDEKWKPKKREKYFYISACGYISTNTFNDSIDNVRLSINNCFKTIEEAEFRLEQIKVYNELKNFADENNKEIDWNNDEAKYHICNKYSDESDSKRYVGISTVYNTQAIGQIYFTSQALTQQAIDKVGADRIKKYLFGVE